MVNMKYEFEMAYIIEDIETTRQLLERNGYKKGITEMQENLYMYHPFFPDMIEEGKYLRLRYSRTKEGAIWGELSFSNSKGDVIDGIPVEVRPSFGRAVDTVHLECDRHFLEMLGFKTGVIMLKKRDYYSSDGKMDEFSVHFELDRDIIVKNQKDVIPDIELKPTLQVCIESNPRAEDNKEKLKKSIAKVVTDVLGIDPSDMVVINYFGRYFDKVKQIT